VVVTVNAMVITPPPSCALLGTCTGAGGAEDDKVNLFRHGATLALSRWQGLEKAAPTVDCGTAVSLAP